MILKSLLFGFLVILIGQIWQLCTFQNPGVCPHNPEACYFAGGYYESRSLFRQKSKQLGFELFENQIKNDKVEDLTVDVAFINKPKTEEERKRAVMVHISGTHGVEGHAGAAIQIAFLDKLLKKEIELPKNVSIILVHALNPFGFLFNRRWNENGVDLNRNFFNSKEDFKEIQGKENSQEYAYFEDLFNIPYSWTSPFNDIKYYFEALYYIIRFGQVKIKGAVVAGQYYCEDCIWYGGSDIEASTRFIIDLLQKNVKQSEKVIIIDVHTGLGDEGIDTLIGTQRQKQSILDIYNRPNSKDVLGKDFLIDAALKDLSDQYKSDDQQSKGETDTMAGYEKVKGTTHNLVQLSGLKKGSLVVQEFGTVKGIYVLKAIIEEQSYWKNKGTPQQLAKGSEVMKSVFHRENAFYKKNIVLRGITLINQTIEALQNNELSKNLPEY